MNGVREGIRLYQTRRWELALTAFLNADVEGATVAENEEIAYFLGLCYTKLERYDDALLYLEQVVTSGANALRAYQCRLSLAYVYAITGRSRLAEFELNHLLVKGFESVQIYSSLAYAAVSQKKIDQAIGYYEKALVLDRENPNALNGLGYLLCDAERDPRKGLSLCLKAAEKRPANPAYLDSVGWAYFKNDRVLEARTWLRRALDIAPKKAEIVSHMKSVMGEAPQ